MLFVAVALSLCILTIMLQCAPMQSCAFTCVFLHHVFLQVRNFAWNVFRLYYRTARMRLSFFFGWLGGRVLMFFEKFLPFSTCEAICPSIAFLSRRALAVLNMY